MVSNRRRYDVLFITKNEGIAKLLASSISLGGGLFDFELIPSVAYRDHSKFSAVLVDVDHLDSYEVGKRIAQEGTMPVVYLYTAMSSCISDHTVSGDRHESWVMNNGYTYHISKHLMYACDSFYLNKNEVKSNPVVDFGQLQKKEWSVAPMVNIERSNNDYFYSSFIGYEGKSSKYYEHVTNEVSRFLRTDKVCVFSLSHSGSEKWVAKHYVGFNSSDVACLFGGDANSPIGVTIRRMGVTKRSELKISALSTMGEYELNENLAGVEVLVPCISPRNGVVAVIGVGERLNGVGYTQSDIDSLCAIARIVGTSIVAMEKKERVDKYNALVGTILSEAPLGILVTLNEKVALYNAEFERIAGLSAQLKDCDEIYVKALGSKLSNIVLSDIKSESLCGGTYNITRMNPVMGFKTFYFTPSHKPSDN